MVVSSKKSELFVYMNSQLIGRLTQLSSTKMKFVYEKSWLQSEYGRPISLSMPLTESPYEGDVVYNYFDNLLPDNESLRGRIQKRFSAKTSGCFDLLSYIGIDCVGALQLVTEPLLSEIPKIDAKAISNKHIAKLIKNYKHAPLGMEENSTFRISIAGAQEKTALLKYKNRWCLPEGVTPTSHIIKLPIGYIEHSGIDLTESIENEWLCLQILSAFGLPTNEVEIAHFDDTKTLVVKRFDRKWSKDCTKIIRLPQEDMCQALGISSHLKYESDGGPGIVNIMEVLRGAYEAKEDRERFMRSVFLFWVLGAIDGHAKNFSILMEAGGNYRLTPLYDVLSAYPLAQSRQLEWKELKMAMALRGKNKHYRWYEIQQRHWLSTANECQFSAALMQNIIDETCDILEAVIEQVSLLLPNDFPMKMADAIFSGMRHVKNRCNGV